MTFQKSGKSAAAVLILLLGVAAAAPVARAQASRPRYSGNPRAAADGWTVPESTTISVRMNNSLSSKTARVGDKFSATVAVPVYLNGETVIPAGAQIEGRVTQVTPAKRMNRSGSIGIDFDQLVFPNGSSTRIEGSLTSDDPYTRKRIDDESKISGENGKNPVVFVGGSGALGAILGGISGGAKGAAVGGAVGAGIGIASILFSKGEEAQVPAGTPFGVQLRQPLFVQTASVGDPAQPADRDPGPINLPSRRHDSDPVYGNRQPAPRDSAPAERVPTDVARDSDREPVSTEPAETRNAEPVRDNESPAESTPAPEPEKPVALDSEEGIRRAQIGLKDQGYYEGATDGVMNERTSTALKVYQREHKLPETGKLDEQTARGLGVIGSTRAPGVTTGKIPTVSKSSSSAQRKDVPANVIGASARRLNDGSIQVSIDTQANTGGWRWFAEHSISGDALEVFAKAVPPTGMVTQVLTKGHIEVNVKEGAQSVRRIVVHGSGADRVVNLNDNSGASSSPESAATAAGLQRRAEDLFAEYQRISGVRMSSSGSLEVGNQSNTREADIELMFALDSFVRSTQLYSRVVSTITDSSARHDATLSMARQARAVDRVITTSNSRSAAQLANQWDIIRQMVLKLMRDYRVSTSEIES